MSSKLFYLVFNLHFNIVATYPDPWVLQRAKLVVGWGGSLRSSADVRHKGEKAIESAPGGLRV
jgi:hypothetical protein